MGLTKPVKNWPSSLAKGRKTRKAFYEPRTAYYYRRKRLFLKVHSSLAASLAILQDTNCGRENQRVLSRLEKDIS